MRMKLAFGNRVPPPSMIDGWPSASPSITGSLTPARMSALLGLDQFLQVKLRGRMLARAEAQAGIEHHQSLAFARTALAPGRLDKQRVADHERLEVPLPGFGPIFAWELRDENAAGAKFQPVRFDFAQTCAQNGARCVVPWRWWVRSSPCCRWAF